jgi:hypothetical protein
MNLKAIDEALPRLEAYEAAELQALGDQRVQLRVRLALAERDQATAQTPKRRTWCASSDPHR